MNAYALPGVSKRKPITHIVSEYFDLPVEKLTEDTRKREICRPRQISIFFLCRFTTLTTSKIGKIFNRDHSTVIVTKKTVKNDIQTNANYREVIHQIEKIIENNGYDRKN